MSSTTMIEEAARAIADAQNVPFVGAKQRRLATAALAVLEKAHETTSDDQAALARVVADFMQPGGCEVTESDQILADRILAAGFRRCGVHND